MLVADLRTLGNEQRSRTTTSSHHIETDRDSEYCRDGGEAACS